MSRSSGWKDWLGKRTAAAACLFLMCAQSVLGGNTVSASEVPALQEQDQAVYETLKSGKRAEPEREYAAPEHPTVYLTFDDGPSKLTPKVLDILKDEGVKATFFELGNEADTYPDTVKRVLEEGHSLGNHTYNHVYKELYGGGFAPFWSQIQKTEAVFDRIAGVKPTLVRAPGGTATNFDAFYYYYLQQAGYRVIDWNIDSSDASRQGVPASEIISTVRKGPFPHEAVVLMHDGTGHDQTVKALPEIIRIFKDKGYDFAPITGETKPVQFSLKPLKWQRSTDSKAFAELLAEAREHAKEIDAAPDQSEPAAQPSPTPPAAASTPTPTPTPTPAADSPSTPAPTPVAVMPVPSLEVATGKEDWVIPPSQYEFRNGRFAVSVKGLLDKLGGKVTFDPERRTLSYRCGLYGAEYDFAHLTLREYAPGRKVKTTHLPDMKLIGADVQAPLRGITEFVGGRIDGYRVAAGLNRVELSMGHREPLLTGTFLETAKPL